MDPLDAVLRVEIVGIGGRPVLVQCRTNLLLSLVGHRRTLSMWRAASLAASSGVLPCWRATM